MSALKMKTLEDSAVKREPEEESTGTTASLDDTETTSSSMLTTEDVFSLLYSDFPHRVAKETSRRERKQNGYISMSLVYGEIAYGPFKSVIDEIKHCHYALQKPGGVFLDIGSGSGKAVFAAALAHDFDACYGIEILEGLHSISQVVLNDWDRRIKRLPSISLQKKRMRIEFAYGDALEMDWPANVDVFFLNSTCFTASFFRELTKKLAMSCKPGAVIITATHALPDTTNFDLLRELLVPQEAWGTATWFVQRKK
ncbi:hypothetical protein Poli38472_007287 [Pythium oligandrum]|uniref:Histone-lysine N-methyltransferase, H3 lysine-79 specific n=1 Tax=Pythium oligandrum TaxID=41045 RepID=A0A8K1CB21_PYTOL|nr:hypothetical protein Poli38472_007287 [Pythium oligandrum]|eukprot:TMW59142.1 hypothetical protein Poli38472_007287 [Pythium oligandrum]